MKKLAVFLGFMLCLLMMSACAGTTDQQQTTTVNAPQASKENEKEAPSATSNEPVEMILSSHIPINEEFDRLYIEPMKEALPHITLNVVPGVSLADIDQYIASGQTPDLYITYNGNIPEFFKRGMSYDMAEEFKKHNIDLSRFQENYMDDIRYAVVGEEGLYGLPFSTTFHALYYNKAIFDKFGVSYPTDGMNWDEAIELAAKVPRFEDGMQYRGFDFNDITRLAQPLGLVYVDMETEKANVTTEEWLKVFQLGLRFASIPGNEPHAESKYNGIGGFMHTQNIAMYMDINRFSELAAAEDLDWDVVQHPYYDEQPNTFGNASVYFIGASQTTKHIDAAIQVIDFFTSDEVQMNVSKTGYVSPLKSEEVKAVFASDNPLLEGKNVTGVLKSRPVQYPIYLYRSLSEQIIRAKFKEVLSGTLDPNTALKQAEEEIDQAIEIEKRAQNN